MADKGYTKIEQVYAAFEDAGAYDWHHAGDIDQFEDEMAEGMENDETIKQIMARIRATLTDEYMDAWIEDNDLTENLTDAEIKRFGDKLDHELAWKAWLNGWAGGAEKHVKMRMEEVKATERREHEVFYLYGEGESEPIEVYDTIDEALWELARLPSGTIRVGDADGPHYEIAGTDPASNDLARYFRTGQRGVGLISADQIDEFSMRRSQARARGWRKNPTNPRNPYEVRSKSGLEEVYADPDDADFAADELRRSGARDVEVRKRSKQTPLAAYSRKANPNLTKDQAEKQFYELIADMDPVGMDIAQDLALEHHLSLVQLSEKQAGELGAKAAKGDYEVIGYFRLAPSFSVGYTPRGVLWSVDKTNNRRHYRYWWGENNDSFFPGAYTRTLEEAKRAAAADAWSIAKALKNMTEEATWKQVQEAAHGAYAYPHQDTTPRELYEHRDTRKKLTYAEAQDAIMSALTRAGWSVSRGLKIPHATSPNGLVRLWFKPQAVYATKIRVRNLENHAFRNARSLSAYADFPDTRSMGGSEFVDVINKRFVKTLGGTT